MADSNAVRAGQAYVELMTKDSLDTGLKKAQAKLRAYGALMTSVGRKMLAAGLAIAGPLAAAAKIYAAMGTQLTLLSAKTGIAVEQLSKLSYIAEQSGSNIEDLSGSIAKMQKNLFSASEGSAQAQQALASLGLSAAQLQQMTPDQQFYAIAKAISAIQNESARTALAMQIFGRSGAGLKPIFEQGADGIAAMQERAQRLGIVISGPAAKAAHEFGQRLDDLWQVSKSLAFTVGEAVAPTFQYYADKMMNAMIYVRDFIHDHQQLVAGLATGAGVLIAAGGALIGLGRALSLTASAIGMLRMGTLAYVNIMGTFASVVLSPWGALGAVVAGAAYAIYRFTSIGGQIAAVVGPAFNDLKSVGLETLDAIKDALTSGDWNLAGQLALAYVKYAWASGKGALVEIWIDVKNKILGTFIDLWTGAKSLAVIAISGIGKAWLEGMIFQQKVFDTFIDGVMSAWYAAEGALKKSWNGMKALWDRLFGDGTFNLSAENAKVDAETAAKKGQRAAASADASKNYDTIKSELEKRLAAWRDQKLSGFAGEGQAKKAEAEKASTSEIEKLRKQLADLKANQHDKIRDFASRAATEALGPKEWAASFNQAAAAGGAGGAMGAAATISRASGTFNASAAFGYGAGGATDKIAKNTEKTNTLLQQWLDVARGGFKSQGLPIK